MSTFTPHTPVSLPTPVTVAPSGISSAELETIVKAAEQFFGATVVPEVEEDPEFDERYYVLSLTVPHSVEETARLRLEWFENLYQLAPRYCHLVRLSIKYS